MVSHDSNAGCLPLFTPFLKEILLRMSLSYVHQVMHLKGEITRLKEKLRLEEKSGAATQQQVRHLYARLDALQGKVKVSHLASKSLGCAIWVLV